MLTTTPLLCPVGWGGDARERSRGGGGSPPPFQCAGQLSSTAPDCPPTVL